MSVLARRARLNDRADLGLAGKLAGSKGAICRVFCLRMVAKDGQGRAPAPCCLAAERAEV